MRQLLIETAPYWKEPLGGFKNKSSGTTSGGDPSSVLCTITESHRDGLKGTLTCDGAGVGNAASGAGNV